MRYRSYPAYKPSGVDWLGDIPAHWEINRLKFVAQLNPDVLPEETHPDYLISYVDITNVDSGGRIVSPQDLRFEAAPSRARRKVKSGDTILSTVRTYLKAIAFIKNPAGNLTVSTGFAVLRPNGECEPRFLYRLVQSHEFVEKVVAHSEGVGYPAINPSELAALPVWLPSRPEQRAIAAFLDRETAKIDALVAKRERLIELLQEKRSVLITDAVTKSVRPSAHMKDPRVGWISEIPAHWDMRRLKFATSFVTSGSRGWAQHYSDEGAIFLRIGNLSRTGIELQLDDVQYVDPPAGAEGRRTKVEPGDLLVSITAYIGSVGVAPEGIGEAYVKHLALARLRREVVEPRWAAYCLLSHVGQPQLRLLLYGGTKDGLGLDDVKDLVVLLPPHAEQAAIVRAIDEEMARMDNLIAKAQDGIVRLKEYRTAIISAAVTGKIDVREEMA